MKLIAGLGNPGLNYRDTRHNLGFMVIAGLLKHFNLHLRRDYACNCLKAKSEFKGIDFVLCKPLSFMNLSGKAIAKLALKNQVFPQNILVICDDINLELGRLRFRARGTSGGHKGLESVISSLGVVEFPRLRIGIGGGRRARELSGYVLSAFTYSEKKVIAQAIGCAREAVLCWLEKGINETMNKFNQGEK